MANTTIIVTTKEGKRFGFTTSGKSNPVAVFRKHQNATRIDYEVTDEEGSSAFTFFRNQFKPEFVNN